MANIQYKTLWLVVVLCLGFQCYARAGVPTSSRKRFKPSTHPPAVMHGDLCARLNGRKFYLEPDASALLYALNVTLPPLPEIAHALPRPPPRRHRRDKSFKKESEDEFESKESSHLSSKVHSTDHINHTLSRNPNEKSSTPSSTSRSDIHYQKQHSQGTKHRNEEERRSHINFKDYPRMKSSFQQFSKSKEHKTSLQHKNKSVLKKKLEEISHEHENSSLNQNTAKEKVTKLRAGVFEETKIHFIDDERKITDFTRKFSANINGLSTLIDKNEQGMEMMRDQAELHNADDSESKMVPAITKHMHCGIELFTCTECHLEFTFRKINLPSCSHDQTCRCDYLRLREPPYIGSSGGIDVCSSGASMVSTYATQTREVSIDFFYTTNYRDAFTISVISKRNRYRIQESTGNGSTGYIRSPFFS